MYVRGEGSCGLASSGPGQTVAGRCEQGNEFSGAMKCWVFLAWKGLLPSQEALISVILHFHCATVPLVSVMSHGLRETRFIS
jgi:hypothetical protein